MNLYISRKNMQVQIKFGVFALDAMSSPQSPFFLCAHLSFLYTVYSYTVLCTVCLDL